MRPSCLTTTLVVESLLAINTVAAAVAAHTLGRLQVLSRGSPCLLTRHALTTSACTRARLRAANDVYIVVRLSSLSHFITPPPIGERSIAMTVSVCVSVSVCVCVLSASISLEKRVQSLPIFFCMSPIDVARSSSVSVAIRYVLRFYG